MSLQTFSQLSLSSLNQGCEAVSYQGRALLLDSQAAESREGLQRGATTVTWEGQKEMTGWAGVKVWQETGLDWWLLAQWNFQKKSSWATVVPISNQIQIRLTFKSLLCVMLPKAFSCFLRCQRISGRRKVYFPQWFCEMPCNAFQISSCSPDPKLKNCPKWFPKVPSSTILFNSGNSEPLEFLSLFYCHRLCVFKLSGLSFVPYYVSQIVSVQQNICPEGNYCSCHKRLFEVTAATGVSLMALQPSKTWIYLTWSCLQVTSSMNLCRLQDLHPLKKTHFKP